MYEQFYGLKRKPFSLVPDPDFLYLSKKHAVALALLEYGLQRLRWRGELPFDLVEVTATAAGFALRFTQPVAAGGAA